jgi:alkyl hydroperoxide reductase subunit AhpC
MIEKTFVCPVVFQVFDELKAEFPEYNTTPLGEMGQDRIRKKSIRIAIGHA